MKSDYSIKQCYKQRDLYSVVSSSLVGFKAFSLIKTTRLKLICNGFKGNFPQNFELIFSDKKKRTKLF
jgi:hypothetical protein